MRGIMEGVEGKGGEGKRTLSKVKVENNDKEDEHEKVQGDTGQVKVKSSR